MSNTQLSTQSSPEDQSVELFRRVWIRTNISNELWLNQTQGTFTFLVMNLNVAVSPNTDLKWDNPAPILYRQLCCPDKYLCLTLRPKCFVTWRRLMDNWRSYPPETETSPVAYHTDVRINMTWLTEKRHQNKDHISPMTLGLALMFPIKSGFRGWDSLLSVLTPIHSRQLLGEHVHYFYTFLSVTWRILSLWYFLHFETNIWMWMNVVKCRVRPKNK